MVAIVLECCIRSRNYDGFWRGIFEPNEITISAGDTVTFTNGELPPHNMVVKDHPELSHMPTWVGKVRGYFPRVWRL